jgi:Tfp pilus assembly protein PilO
MKAIAILAIVMFALLIAAVSGLAWQSHKREQAEKSLTSTREELKQTGDVLTEVRALRQDVNQVAGLKKLNQQRNTTGEHRRENIKTALAGDPCAACACCWR